MLMIHAINPSGFSYMRRVTERNVDLPMSIGAVAMSASTMIVAVNAQLLRRLNLRRAVHSRIN